MTDLWNHDKALLEKWGSKKRLGGYLAIVSDRYSNRLTEYGVA